MIPLRAQLSGALEPLPDPAEVLDPAALPDQFLQQGRLYRNQLHRWLQDNNPRMKGRQALRRFTKGHDALIRAAFEHASDAWRSDHDGQDPPTVCLVALGGYGRQRLYLNSDIDLMVLMAEPAAHAESFARTLVHLMIDLKMDLGLSTRTPEDCEARVGMDIESVTAMIESRFLIGSRALYRRYFESLRTSIRHRGQRWFLRAIYQQWLVRHEKFESTVFLLEPNIKEGQGGLRDVHSVMWTLFGLTGSTDLKGLIEHARFHDEDLERYRENIGTLQTVRNELHIASQGKTDQLSFAYQPTIAERLGYAGDGTRLPHEIFMDHYYRSAQAVARTSRRAFLCMIGRRRSIWGNLIGDLGRRRLDTHAWLQNGRITLEPPLIERMSQDHQRIFGVFKLVAQSGDHLSDEAKESLERRVAPLLGPAFRLDATNSAAFMQILGGRWHAAAALSDMHECGVLGRFITEFERLRGMVRIDHYHHYTVDEHTLKALAIAENLAREPADKRSLAGRLANEVQRWDLLMLSLLLHDIGKGYGRGHALRGGQVAQRIADRLGLVRDDTELVRFLVLSHLKLTHASQRRDVSDPHVAGTLAEEIGSLERLKLLFVHTVADIKAVSPEAWNDWKKKLLDECYHQIAGHLGQSHSATGADVNDIDRLRRDLMAAIDRERASLTEAGGVRADFDKAEDLVEDLDRFLKHVTTRYLQLTSTESVARHFLMYRTLDERNALTWWLHQDPNAPYTDLAVCAADVPGLFNKICGALAAKDINILSARIFSTTDGYAINQFQVTDAENRALPPGLRLERLRQDLIRVMHGEKTIEELLRKHRGRRRPQPPQCSPHPSDVRFDNKSSQSCTVIELRTTDRPGLLFAVTRALSDCDLDIQRAFIATEAYGVVDVFYVTDLEYNKIHDPNQQEQIRRALLRAADEASMPADPSA